MRKNNLNKAVSLRHELHRHPELSGNETWTIEHLKNFIRENTALQIVDKGRWFYACYRTTANLPGIAFRADIDALPVSDEIDAVYRSVHRGLGHKCGHDGHAATLAALAIEVNDEGADRDVYFLFQHGEEIGAGAKECT